jgi:anti-sigma-K factor RskA
MKCTTTNELLEEFRAGSLTARDADEVRRHLDGCAACRDELAAIDGLQRAAAALPRSIDPARDLWPEIAERLTSDGVVRPSFGGAGRPATAARTVPAWRWLAAAAVVIMAVMAAYQLGRSQRSGPVAHDAGPGATSSVVAASASPDVELELQEVRDDLRARLDLRREVLDPATLQVIDDNLELIDGAIERISAALDSDPGNARLTRQLVFAYRQQIDLLRRSTEMPLEL